MDFLKLFIDDRLGACINIVIIVISVAVIIEIMNLKKEIKKNLEKTKVEFSRKTSTVEMDKDANMKVITGTNIDPDSVNSLKSEYDKICINYSSISQTIGLLPSIGILGTVFGLMMQVQSEGIVEMTGSIGIALTSTFLALVFTIVLKFYMTKSVYKSIGEIEVEHNNYDRVRQDNVDKHTLSKE